MKILLLLAIAIYGAYSLSLTSEIVSAKWEGFKSSYKKAYINSREEAFRKQVFQGKLQYIEEHNERFRQGLEPYELGLNQFSDFTDEEMRAYTDGLIIPPTLPEPTLTIKDRTSLSIPETTQLPQSFDWRDYGIVTAVKNQGQCGACWAFSATGALEAHVKKNIGASVSLSEQQLVDCVPDARGCSGGWMNQAFTYIAQTGGIDNDAAYPYEARDSSCRYRSDQVAARVTGYAYLSGPDENMLADMVATQGPVSVAIDASGDFGYYRSGVYYNATCNPTLFNHAVLVVGYGTENNQDYWLVKNSWGADWGDNGYIKMARNRNNNCGIAGAASYPVL